MRLVDQICGILSEKYESILSIGETFSEAPITACSLPSIRLKRSSHLGGDLFAKNVIRLDRVSSLATLRDGIRAEVSSSPP